MDNGATSEEARSSARTRDRNPVYWDIDDVQFHCRIGRSTAWRLVRDAGFPSPVVLGRRTVLWPRDEVLAFVEDKRDPDHYGSDQAESRPPSFTVRPSRRRRIG
jgi:predicted DNA-binding transcriptional regulator AlpA